MARGLSEVTGQPEAEFGLAARAYTPSPWHRPRGLWASWCQAAQRLLLLKPGERRAEGQPTVFQAASP